jgi:hypothetical protein
MNICINFNLSIFKPIEIKYEKISATRCENVGGYEQSQSRLDSIIGGKAQVL